MFLLVPDIPTDNPFINAGCSNKVSSCPQGSSIAQTGNLFVLFLDPFGRFTLDYRHTVGDAVSGVNAHAEMNMVNLDIQLKDFKTFPLANTSDNTAYFFPKIIVVEDLPPVFRSPDNVVFTVVKAM